MTVPAAAVYARVSTADQTTANQLGDLRRLAAARGWDPVVYEEQESAAKVRPVLDRLMLDARAGKVRGVVVWALDRLDRNMVACILRVVELDRLGVPVVSVREPWLDTGVAVRAEVRRLPPPGGEGRGRGHLAVPAQRPRPGVPSGDPGRPRLPPVGRLAPPLVGGRSVGIAAPDRAGPPSCGFGSSCSSSGLRPIVLSGSS
jgi:hypothetical protein